MKISSQRLTIGIVGAGEIARKSHLPVLANIPEAKISWIYDRRQETAQGLAHAYGLRALHAPSPAQLPACDVVLLAIPVDARAPYLDHFSSAGAAVFCEKPFATSSTRHKLILDQFPPHALGVGFMRRFFQSNMLLRQIVADEIFGPLLGIDVSEGNRSKGSGVDSSFLDDPRLGVARGVLTDLGSHSIDAALYVTDATGFDVESCSKVMDGGVDRKVTASIRLHTTAHGSAPINFRYRVSWLDRQENRVQLTFQRAIVWSGLAPGAEVFVAQSEFAQRPIRLASQAPGATTYNHAFYLEWKDFLDSLRVERESVSSARRALLTTSLVEALLAARSDGDG